MRLTYQKEGIFWLDEGRGDKLPWSLVREFQFNLRENREQPAVTVPKLFFHGYILHYRFLKGIFDYLKS